MAIIQNQLFLLNLLYIAGMALILILVYNKKWLTGDGAVSAFVLGCIIIWSTNILFIIPILIFFTAGSLSSRLHHRTKDSQGRTARQVLANGMIATAAVFLYGITKLDAFAMAYFISICVSLTDTLSSDIGIYFNKKTYDITTLKPVEPGLSGGISAAGTLAGMLGACIFSALVATLFLPDTSDGLIISFWGVTGMLIDSIFGSLWQAKYAHHGKIVEEKSSYATLIKGLRWMDNDVVNLLSNALVVLSVLIIEYITLFD
jgi:uncharacterized protein (TIGR00297 family)